MLPRKETLNTLLSPVSQVIVLSKYIKEMDKRKASHNLDDGQEPIAKRMKRMVSNNIDIDLRARLSCMILLFVRPNIDFKVIRSWLLIMLLSYCYSQLKLRKL